MAGDGIKINNTKIVGGADGATFIPFVDEQGNLSWTNNKGYNNPQTVNIRGIDGKNGEDGATGAKLISQVLQGQDANGGNIYKQTFDDGTTAIFVAPKGEQGEQGEQGEAGKDHSEEIAQLNEKLETYFISAKEQIDINSEEISKNSAKIHNLTGALLEGGVMGVVEVSQAFTTRQTADGENIIDNQNMFPKKIAGSTQNCYSLVDFSSAASANGLTVTANNNTVTISGTPTVDYAKVFSANITDLLEDGKTYTMWQSVAFSSATASGAFFMFVIIYDSEGTVVRLVDSAVGQKTFTCNKSNGYIYRIWLQSGTIENVGTINSTISFMLYEGTDEKPYQPYFKGLKNAYFEKVVSTGRSLVDFSSAKTS